MKYLHAWPILDASRRTDDLIAEAYAMLREQGPRGHRLTRLEWNRVGAELVLLCDAEKVEGPWVKRCRIGPDPDSGDEVADVRWVRVGMTWKAA